MEIILDKLTLINFKGLRNRTIEFGPSTNIFGANESGKTTICDAFLWLLFGKDSTDREKFEIKTLDSRNNVIPKISHEVEGHFRIDGETAILKRVLEENWVKKRGTPEPVMDGNITSYFWNGVPQKQSEYQSKINTLVNEKAFKLLTNALYFNEVLKWEERRSVLMQIAGDITDADIASGDATYEKLMAEIGKESLSDFKKKLAAEKKKLKEALETLPTRIDEATRSMPDPIDFSIVEKNIAGKKAELAQIEKEVSDTVAALKEKHEAINGKQKEIHALNTQIAQKEHSIKSGLQEKKSARETEISNLKRDSRNLNDELTRNKSDYLTAENRKKAIVTQQNQLREDWNKLNAQQSEILKEEFVFDESKCSCPTCKQRLPEENITQQKETLKKNFENDKTNRAKTIVAKLKETTDTGKRLGDEINELDKKVTDLMKSNEDLLQKIQAIVDRVGELEAENNKLSENESGELNNALAFDEDLLALQSKVDNIQKEIDAINTPEQGGDALKQSKINVQGEIDLLNKQFNAREQIEKTKLRIADLEKEEKNLAQQIADLEGKEFVIQNFERAKSDALEGRVNGMFRYVRFKLFETQINGAEVPCCHTTYKGVPWSDLNTAGKIWAGLDIIAVLSEHYKVKAPIFLDNRESVTDIPETGSQIINLIVSPEDKTLRIETQQLAEAV